VQRADEAVRIGPAPSLESYLSQQAVLHAAAISGSTAIHPGYGFLAENGDFAEACENAGLTFIGPTPENIRLAGNKLEARRALDQAGIAVVPGSVEPLPDGATAKQLCKDMGYPIMLKAAAGGGGRGMRVVSGEEALAEEYAMAQAEARAAFGDPTLYVEKLVKGARHIEVQVLGDGSGQGIHLGERNCSLQRRHQKMLEEAPSPALSPDVARELHRSALKAVEVLRYRNAGTVEFLVDGNQDFFFLEVNARIQVEHPVTEAITGVDLVEAQMRIAAEGRLPFPQDAVEIHGHSIECRINAEDPDDEFLPQPGEIATFRRPASNGVRFDSHIYEGYTVPFYYDSLLGKLITHGADRPDAIEKMKDALSELTIGPIRTTIPFLQRVLDEESFRQGSYNLDLFKSLVPEDEEDD
jgi:acetyl-CoA carboxylase biotin carboxylase subunit